MINKLSINVNLHDPTDVDSVAAYCVLSEISLKLDTGAVCCVFACWRSQKAYEQNCKPFAMLPVVLNPDEPLNQLISKHAGNLNELCNDLLDLLDQPERKVKIEQNARQNTANN